MTTLDATAHVRPRIAAIDVIRGLIMIIMTLDHVRDFLMFPGASPVDMKNTTVILFLTRWITHFCAPTFLFLSGVSAFLAGQRRSKKQLSAFLLKRGLWLVVTDLLIISFVFSFDPAYHFLVLEVLAATGFGMMILAALIWLPVPVITAIGVLILVGHNLLDGSQFQPTTVSGGLITFFLTAGGTIVPYVPGRFIAQLYPVLPWAAAMFLGYGFGTLYVRSVEAVKRQRVLLLSGIGITLLFIIVRIINHYGDPQPWAVQRNAAHSFISFLNATKQPPSLLYMSMTLGPVLILLSLAERVTGAAERICRVYGNVPYFYFVGHLVFIRILNIVFIAIQGVAYKSTGFPMVWQADGFGFPLWAVYLFWLLTLVLLYFPCKWYGRYKVTHTNWWLSYI